MDRSGLLVKLLRGTVSLRMKTGARRISASSVRCSVSSPQLAQYFDDIPNEFSRLHQTLFPQLHSKIAASVAQPTAPLDVLRDRYIRIQKALPQVQARSQKLADAVELESLQEDLEEANDQEMVSLAAKDLRKCREDVVILEEQILDTLIPEEVGDAGDLVLEVSAGVGGQEAMLFAHDIFRMYERYSVLRGWVFQCLEEDESDLEGLRFASAIISGLDVYKCLKFESGVHRVQRTPKTEKAGRIHTSTVSVAVLPKPRDVEIVLKKSDLRIETCRSTGAGGQHVNKTESAIRVVHLPTNIAVECQEQRSQIDNKMTALERLAAKLYQIQIDARAATESFDRKMQVGSSSRSEKIRTYNFPQDRLTDHRTGTNFHGLTELIKGGSKFHDLVEHMVREYRKESIGHLLLASFSAKTVSDQEKRKVG